MWLALYRWRRLLKADVRMFSSGGNADWHAFMLVLLAWNATLIVNMVLVFNGFGCSALYMIASGFIWSKANRCVGSSLKQYGQQSAVYVFLPPIVSLAMVGALASPVAGDLIALVVLLPFMFLTGVPGIGGSAKLCVALAGFTYLLNRPAVTGPVIVHSLTSLYLSEITAVGCMILFTLLLFPASAFVRARVGLSYTINNCAREISKEMSNLLRPRKDPESKASDALPAQEPGSEVEQDVTAKGVDARPVSSAFQMGTGDADMGRLLRADQLFGDTACEPSFRHLRHRPEIGAWKQLIEQTKALVIGRSVLHSVSAFSEGEHPTGGVDPLFRDESTKDLWAEIGASMTALLSVLAEWVISRLQLDDCAKTGDLRQRIESRQAHLRKAITPLLVQLDVRDDSWRQGVTADQLFLALSVQQLAEETMSLKDAADALGAESEKASNENIWHNTFGWFSFGILALYRGLKATFPDLSSPAALRQFLLSPVIQVAVRIVLMVVFVGVLDIFVISNTSQPKIGGWIFLTAVIVHSPTVEATLQKALCRMLGTIVGAVVGTAPMLSPVFATNPVLITVYACGVTSTVILIFEMIPSNIVARIAYTEQLFMLTFFMASGCVYTPACTQSCATTWTFTVTRTIGIVIGSLVSVVFELFVFPQYAQTEARERLSATMQQRFELVKTITDSYESKLAEARGKATYSQRLKALAANGGEEKVPDGGKQTENQPLPDHVAVQMERLLTADMYKDLRHLSTELRSIQNVLGGIHIITDSWVVARLTLAAPGFLTRLVGLLRNVDLILYSMGFLSVQEFAVWSGSHWDGWTEQINKLVSRLGLLVYICAQVVYKDVPTMIQIEIIKNARQTFAETREMLRKQRKEKVAPIVPAAKQRLAEHIRAYRTAHPDGEVPSTIHEAAADLMLHQCGLFLFEAVQDGCDEIASEFQQYLTTQRETRQKWGQLLRI